MQSSGSRYHSLPPQGIRIGGWIGQQIREDAANGWVSICDRMSHEGIMGWDANSLTPIPYYLPWEQMRHGREAWNRSVPYYQPLIDRMGSYGEGEFEGHWLDTLVRMAWIGGVSRFKDLAHEAVNAILDSLDETGYIGVNLPWVRYTGATNTPWGKNWQGEVGGGMEVVNALLTYYRFTGSDRVLQAATKAADLTLERTKGRELWGDAGWQAPLGLVELYRATGNEAYLDRARLLVNACLDGRGEVLISLPPLEMGAGNRIDAHTAATAYLLLEMLGIYSVSGDARMLARALAINERVERYAMQAHGVPTGHGETFVPSSPRANSEGCDIAWFGWAWLEMLKATGEARYADLAEKAALNALPGHRSKDGSVTPYFSRPNQLFATRGSHWGTVYGARVFTECCHGNLGRLLPVLAENMVLRAADGSYIIPFYGSSCFEDTLPESGGRVQITQETGYPFSEDVKITVRPTQPAVFAIRLRKPAWCEAVRVRINGQETPVEAEASWIDLDRLWGPCDVVELALPMRTQVEIGEDGLAVVTRGPLVYALPVEGRRIEVDRWGSFEELVTTESRWNYALVLDKADPAGSLNFRELDVPDGASLWAPPRVALEVDAVRVPEWKFDRDPALLIPGVTTDIPEPPFPARPVTTTGPTERIRLVPYGCTILRMTHLPVVDCGA